MLIASAIVKVPPERAQEVSDLLARVPRVTTYGVHKETNVVIVMEAHDTDQLESLHRYILDQFPDVLAVFPTFVADEDGGGDAVRPDGDGAGS